MKESKMTILSIIIQTLKQKMTEQNLSQETEFERKNLKSKKIHRFIWKFQFLYEYYRIWTRVC